MLLIAAQRFRKSLDQAVCMRLCALRLLLPVITALSLGACGSGESNVVKGNRAGILHAGNGTEPQGLDPHVVTGVTESLSLIHI